MLIYLQSKYLSHNAHHTSVMMCVLVCNNLNKCEEILLYTFWCGSWAVIFYSWFPVYLVKSCAINAIFILLTLNLVLWFNSNWKITFPLAIQVEGRTFACLWQKIRTFCHLRITDSNRVIFFPASFETAISLKLEYIRVWLFFGFISYFHFRSTDFFSSIFILIATENNIVFSSLQIKVLMFLFV